MIAFLWFVMYYHYVFDIKDEDSLYCFYTGKHNQSATLKVNLISSICYKKPDMC